LKVLIDTNIIIDFLLTREPFFKASYEVMIKCATGEWNGYMALHSVSNLWYVLRKIPEERRRKCLRDVCNILEVVGASNEAVLKAVDMVDFKDFEDCLQDRCAEGIGAEYIITRNVNDFENSVVKAILPEDILR
jgi:predicted nucleic acid-binding protein